MIVSSSRSTVRRVSMDPREPMVVNGDKEKEDGQEGGHTLAEDTTNRIETRHVVSHTQPDLPFNRWPLSSPNISGRRESAASFCEVPVRRRWGRVSWDFSLGAQCPPAGFVFVSWFRAKIIAGFADVADSRVS